MVLIVAAVDVTWTVCSLLDPQRRICEWYHDHWTHTEGRSPG